MVSKECVFTLGVEGLFCWRQLTNMHGEPNILVMYLTAVFISWLWWQKGGRWERGEDEGMRGGGKGGRGRGKACHLMSDCPCSTMCSADCHDIPRVQLL